MNPQLRLLLIVAIAVAIAVCAAFALMKLHQSNVAIRQVQLDRLMRVKAVTKGASNDLGAAAAEYASAYSAEAAAARKQRDVHEELTAINSARVANERIAKDMQAIAQAYTGVYGFAATQRLRAAAASAHDTCARSLEAWARATGLTRDAEAEPYYAISKREDGECAQHGMELGTELDGLGSRLDADLSATQASLSTL